MEAAISRSLIRKCPAFVDLLSHVFSMACKISTAASERTGKSFRYIRHSIATSLGRPRTSSSRDDRAIPSALALGRPKNLINMFEYKRLGALSVDPGKIAHDPLLIYELNSCILEESNGLEPRYLGKSQMACKLHA